MERSSFFPHIAQADRRTTEVLKTKNHLFFHQELFSSQCLQLLPISHPTVVGSGTKQIHPCIHHLFWQQETEPGTWLELKPNPSKVHRSTQLLRPAAGFCRTGGKQGVSACTASRSHIPPVLPEVRLHCPNVPFLH